MLIKFFLGEKHKNKWLIFMKIYSFKFELQKLQLPSIMNGTAGSGSQWSEYGDCLNRQYGCLWLKAFHRDPTLCALFSADKNVQGVYMLISKN